MASDEHAGPEQTPPEHAAEEPTRPTQPYHPGPLPPNGAGLVENQSYANAVFKRNSQMLQESAAERQAAGDLEAPEQEGRQDQLSEDRSPSAPNYAALKQEHSAGADRSDNAEPQRGGTEDQNERAADKQSLTQEEKAALFRETMQESARQVFSRDQSRGAGR